MNTDITQQVLNRLDNLDNNVKEINSNMTIMAKDMSELKLAQVKLSNDNAWIKVLFGGAFSVIIVLLSVLLSLLTGEF